MDIYSSILPAAGAVSIVSGAWYSVLKILRELRKTKKAEADRIIEECKELDLIAKNKLEAKINLLEAQLHNIEINVAKDLSNLKESHAVALSNLSEKIESIRDQLNEQHSQLLSFLTRLLDK
jgi:hypothetical protein